MDCDFGRSFRCVAIDNHHELPTFVCEIVCEITPSFRNHYYVSPAPESGHGFRQILVKGHWTDDQLRENTLWYHLDEKYFTSLVFNNFPVHEVTDWTPEEAEEISLAYCPTRQPDVDL
jgi:hypothetical protein